MAASFATVFSKLNITPPSAPITSNDSVSDSLKISFKTEELDFFNPELPIEYGSRNVIKINKNIIYRNVHLFV